MRLDNTAKLIQKLDKRLTNSSPSFSQIMQTSFLHLRKLQNDPILLTMKPSLLAVTEKDKTKLWSLLLCSSLLPAMKSYPFFCTTPLVTTSLTVLTSRLAYRVIK